MRRGDASAGCLFRWAQISGSPAAACCDKHMALVAAGDNFKRRLMGGDHAWPGVGRVHRQDLAFTDRLLSRERVGLFSLQELLPGHIGEQRRRARPRRGNLRVRAQ